MHASVDTGQEIKSRIFLQIENFQQLARKSNVNPEITVHELRKCMKRIRALFRLLKPAIQEYDYHNIGDKLKRISFAIETQRDSSVNLTTFIAMLDQLGTELSEHSRGIILRALVSYRDQAYAVEKPDLSTIIQNQQMNLSRLKDQLDVLPVSEYPHYVMIKAIEFSYYRTVRFYHNALLSVETEVIHKWRKQLKVLLLQLKFSFDEVNENIQDKIIILDHLTNLLGNDHDFSMLESVIYSNFKSLIPKEEFQYLLHFIDRNRNKIQKEAFLSGRVFVNLPAPYFELMSESA